jgi:polyisoprenoid-binding protein YceI
VKATFELAQGALRVGDGGTLTNVSAEIDASSFYSRNGRRDKHVKSADFLDVTRYPTISFAGRDLRSDAGELVLAGSVTIHGVTAPVDVRLGTVAMTDGLARLEASAALDRTRFGVTHMPKRIGREVSLTFKVGAARI